jgi:hypothetical protein
MRYLPEGAGGIPSETVPRDRRVESVDRVAAAVARDYEVTDVDGARPRPLALANV